MTKWPKISILLLTFNGGDGVRKCLDSVRRQVYPKDKIEIIVIDNGSTDNTVEIAKKYTKKVTVSNKNGYINRADGMRMATGEFVYMTLEQDIEFRGKYFLKKMILPFLENEKISASFTREYPRKDQPWVTRFISHHPVQCDPLFEYLTTSIEETIIDKKNDYYICRYVLGKVPPTTHMFFKISFLKKTSVWKQVRDDDHDTVIKLIKCGYDLFAYVPEAGDYHNHAKNLKELIQKRVRNLNRHYFPYNNTTEYKWLNVNSKKEILRMLFWTIYANSLILPAARGVKRYLKYRDWALLLEPIVTLTTTDVILWSFITNNTGRSIIFNSIKNLIRIK